MAWLSWSNGPPDEPVNSGSDVQHCLIVVVSFNGLDWLKQCLASIDAQRVQEHLSLHVCVVDNASEDGSRQWLSSLSGQDHLTLVFNQTNVGFAAACNQAAESRPHDLLLLLNPDCVLPERGVAELAALMADEPRAGLIAPRVDNLDGREQRGSRRRLPTPGRALITALGLERLGLSGVNLKPVASADAMVEAEAVSGAVMLIRSECWSRIGGMDEGYFLHCEDLDLFVRIRQAGWLIFYCPMVRVMHAKGISQQSCQRVSQRHKYQSMQRFFDQHLGARCNPLMRWIWPRFLALRHGMSRRLGR